MSHQNQMAHFQAYQPIYADSEGIVLGLLNTVFRQGQQGYISLVDFLLVLLTSENTEIKRRTGLLLLSRKIPTIVSLIFQKCKNKRGLLLRTEEYFHREIVGELDTLSKSKELQTSPTHTHLNIFDNFSLNLYSELMVQRSPMLSRLLHSVLDGKALAISTIGSIMTRYTNSRCNLYQKVMGTYLFSNGTSRKTMEALSHAELSVSYSTVMRILRQLTVNALADVRAVAANKSWYIVYDNLNFRRVKHDQRLDNRDNFVSGTTATLIQCDPTNGAFNQGSYERLCFKDLIINRDNDAHFQEVATYHLINVLKRHYEAFKSLQNDAPVKNLLPAKKSETFPLPSMDINESTTEGNKDVINTIINNTLQLPREWFNSERHIVVAGDQLTIKNIRSLLKYRRDHYTHYSRLEWVIPLIQLFHLQMVFAATILRTYYGSITTPGSLAHFAEKLRRKRISLEKLDFHAVNELIHQVFEAVAWRAWRVVMKSSRGESSAEYASRKANEIFEKFVCGTNSFLNDNNKVSFNGSLLFRDMMLYVELSHAIRSGDIGRIEEVIKWLTIMFQAGCTKNYAHELIHLQCGLQYAWPKETKNAIMSTWLVNTSGRPMGFIPADLYQEHNNLLIKVIHAAKGHNASMDFIANSISTNIEAFKRTSILMETEYKVARNRTYHKSVKFIDDVTSVLETLEDIKLFSKESKPTVEAKTKRCIDRFNDGVAVLSEGKRLEAIKQKNMSLDHNTENSLDPFSLEVDLTDVDTDEIDLLTDPAGNEVGDCPIFWEDTFAE